MTRPRPARWLRVHPQAADWLLAGVLAAISATFHLTYHEAGMAEASVLGVLLSLGATLPVGMRRRWPVQVLLVVAGVQLWMEAVNAGGPGWMGVLVATYTLGAYRRGRVLWRLSGAILTVVVAFIVLGVVHGDAPWQALVSTPVIFVSSIVFGDNVRRRRDRAIELAERAERAERERLMLAHQHVQEERARIARELHDVVAHSVSLMVIQAAAARRQLAADPARADAALATVEDTGRTAMQEMRRILGVLREPQAVADLTPQPGLAGIAELAGAAHDLHVRTRTEGDFGDVPTGVELSAYRIVQEALTNVRRHAGPVQHVDVSVVRSNGSLTVEVCDDGRGAAALPDAAGPGFGLVGMRERVAAYDGQLAVGPRPGGGWRVRATFPVAG
ncbi:MAG: sensor histidine kinase [Actinomycetota bacterium]|nr:sensor histidine kinase [Actinomycetota bacterium]